MSTCDRHPGVIVCAILIVIGGGMAVGMDYYIQYQAGVFDSGNTENAAFQAAFLLGKLNVLWSPIWIDFFYHCLTDHKPTGVIIFLYAFAGYSMLFGVAYLVGPAYLVDQLNALNAPTSSYWEFIVQVCGLGTVIAANLLTLLFGFDSHTDEGSSTTSWLAWIGCFAKVASGIGLVVAGTMYEVSAQRLQGNDTTSLPVASYISTISMVYFFHLWAPAFFIFWFSWQSQFSRTDWVIALLVTLPQVVFDSVIIYAFNGVTDNASAFPEATALFAFGIVDLCACVAILVLACFATSDSAYYDDDYIS